MVKVERKSHFYMKHLRSQLVLWTEHKRRCCPCHCEVKLFAQLTTTPPEKPCRLCCRTEMHNLKFESYVSFRLEPGTQPLR